MSTKRIREFLEHYSAAMPSDAPSAPEGGKHARAALRDLEAIEAACAFVVREDAITDVENEHIDIIKAIAREANK